MPRALLFDHDGVLVTSEPLHRAAWEELFKELGLPYNEAELRQMVGKTAPETLASVLDRYRPGWDPKDYDLDELALRKNDFYLEFSKTRLVPYPGVREGLEWLKEQGIPAAVVSNAKRRELEATLTQLGLIDFFEALVSRDEAKVPKPDPTPYLMGAAILGFDPKDCLAVEDSPPGLEAALVAKVPAAAVMTNFPREVLEKPVPGREDLKPIWIGASLAELFGLMRRLCSSYETNM